MLVVVDIGIAFCTVSIFFFLGLTVCVSGLALSCNNEAP